MPETHAQRVAAEIRAAMAYRQKTQTDLGVVLKISQAAVSRRLTAAVAFDVDEVAAIASWLDVPLSALVLGRSA